MVYPTGAVAAGDGRASSQRTARRHPRVQGSSYWTAMVTVFETTPSIEVTTGTAAPLDDPSGTRAFTWYRPTPPGASPENSTVAGAPPMVTSGGYCVVESGLLTAAEPSGG